MSEEMERIDGLPADASAEQGMRLAKFLATAGIGSRRSCEDYIREGRVTVNGAAVTAVGTCVSPEEDEVCFEGKPVTLANRGLVYLMLNKPVGYTCSAKDVHATNLVYQLIPERFGRVFTVGRLDRDSEGLLLLTNDGDFAQRLTHPSHEIYKRYYVECDGRFTTSVRRQLLNGMYDNGEFLRALNVEQVSVQHGFCKLIFTLGEGRKREVRRLCKDVGLRVTLLRRVAIGQLELDEKLTVGSWRILSPHDCELALQPVAVPEQPRPSEPPKPYWVKDKPEHKSRVTHDDREDESGPRGYARGTSRGSGVHERREDSRRRRREEWSEPVKQKPWYEQDSDQDGKSEEPRGYGDDAPRKYGRGGSSRGYGRGADEAAPRGGYGDDAPRKYGRGGSSRGYGHSSDAAAPRGGYGDDAPRKYGHGSADKKPASRSSGNSSGFRRNKPPRSWR